MFRLASRSLKSTRISSLSASRSLSFSSSKHVGALIRSTNVCVGVQQPRSTPLFARTGVPMRSYSTDNVYRSVWDRRNTNEFQTSLRRLVKVLSEQGEWWAAEAFIPTEDGTLKPSKVFKTLRGAQWRQKHKELLAERNSLSEKVAGKSSAINQAFESGEAQWLTSSNNEFVNGAGAERQSFASNIDAKTVFVQPIRVEGKTVAVVAFYAPDVRPRNDAMIKHARHTIRGLLEAGLSHDDTAAPFQEEDYRELVDPADNPAPVQIMNEVFGILSLQGVFSDNVVYAEIDWFFRHLQLDAAYFRLFSTDEVAQHIELLIAAKRMASAAGRAEHITLDAELENGGSIHVVPNDEESVDALEARFEKMFHEEEESGENVLSLSMFRSKRSGLVGGNLPLLVYIVHRSKFSNKNVKENETDLSRVATDLFLETKPEYVSKHYLDVISTTADRLSPTLKIVSDTSSGGKQVMFCFREDKMTMHKLSEMVSQQGLHLERKFVERFANGMRVYSMFLSPTNRIEDKIATLIHTTSLLHTLPRNNELLPHFLNKTLTAEQYAYAAAVSRFMFYFITKQSEDYQHLLKAFQKVNDEENIAILTNLHARLRTAAVSPARIMDCVANHLPIIKELYNDFRRVSTDVNQKPSFNKDLASKIKKAVSTEIDERILNAFVNFNAHVVKTNFFCSKKVSLSFRLDDTFIPQGEVIERPYAIFLVLGPTFQGFHVRFRDVSRGGIRLIPFTNPTAYLRNEASQFNENFALAYTQNQKNKDIPEFGSKGTVLMDPAAPRTPAANQHAFQHYVSGLLDLIVPNDDSVHRDVKVKADHLGHEELLFLGPDENTADFMQWAALYARYRGYRHWKSITTGKPPSLGGIPHDTYGMTTRSVHQYVMGVLNKLGLQESQVTKLQTGGPDGDLGSNEIFLSHDRTTSIVDGSGVLYDPNGLDRDELTRLAKERRMCSHFNTSALGDGGFFISVDARDVTLPNGELVESGLQFRNEFHLHPLSSADLFVPCGGRPEAINIDNVHRMFDEEGNPRFKIIVEGANLFLTQDARLRLERAGVILYRDASANKGGVTSSSLEVLAALSLTDAEFGEHMCVEPNQTPPKFYSDYVIDVQNIIEENARLEFECIWKEHQSSGAPRSILTTKVSDKINLINDFITKSSLYDDADVRRAVMARAMPKTLVNLVGLDELLDNRVPASYSRALFSCYVASRYVYKYGLNSPEVAFFEFMRTLTEKK